MGHRSTAARREQRQAYYQRNKERIKAQVTARYRANRDAILAKQRAYNHRPDVIARRQAYEAQRNAGPERKARRYERDHMPTRNAFLRGQRKHTKAAAVAYLGGACQLCGYSRCHGALDFHHRDPRQKEYNLCRLLNNYRGVGLTEEIRSELDKCVLLCRNCHAEVHAGIGNSPDLLHRSQEVGKRHADTPRSLFQEMPS